MENIQKIFIAREYLLTDDGAVRIDEEAIFSSFQEANNYLKILEDKNAEGNNFLLFRMEIAEYAIGQIESCLRKWIYNLRGDLIDTFPSSHDNRETDEFKYTGKYRVGDIVYIAPNIENKLSPSVKGTYGVIIETPVVPGNQLDTAEIEEEARREYLIYYITEDGLLGHLHVFESVLNTPKTRTPNEFKFLELYSKHLKKVNELPDNLITQLLDEEIFIKNIATFDFRKGSIRKVED